MGGAARRRASWRAVLELSLEAADSVAADLRPARGGPQVRRTVVLVPPGDALPALP